MALGMVGSGSPKISALLAGAYLGDVSVAQISKT